MKKTYFLLLLLPLLVLQSFGQNKETETIETKMDAYFNLDYETFYTHLNKTTYFTNEEIWFKTYVYNTKTQLPYISTTNVYTSLYDENGRLIKKKMYTTLDGMTHGNIKIDSTFLTGTYYLKTDSNWSKNFSLDNTHVQKIEIINEIEDTIKKESIASTYDFQLLPEGGHILEESTNTVGFKVVNALGESVKIVSGKIIEDTNHLIGIFKSNTFGLGKFHFKPEKNKLYTCEITLENGEIITKKISDIATQGVSLQVENNRVENVIININTNKNTIAKLSNKTYYALIHRDGFIKKIPVPFSKDQLNYSYNIKRSLLHKGINIVTLINENQKPIAERILFNTYNSAVKSLEIDRTIKEGDSTIVLLKTDSKINNTNLSISILPSKTKANKGNSSIVASFLIHPYIKGTIENPWYYFNEINKEKIYNLDLLLLTQGWSKYSWENIFNHPPKVTHTFETGLEIKGKINNYNFKSGDKIVLQSIGNGIQEEFSLDDSGFFNFTKLFIREQSNILFSLKNKKGNLSIPKLYYNTYPSYKKDVLHINNSVINSSNTKILFPDNMETFAYDKEITMLDNVALKDVINKPKQVHNPVGMNLAKHISFAEAKNVNSLITSELYNYFNVSNIGGTVSITSRRFTTLNPIAPKVFLDDVDISGSLDILSHLRVLDVEEMFVLKGLSNLVNAAGVIRIYTKRGYSKPAKASFNDSEIPFGFSIAKTYYNPIYNKRNYENFNNYGVLNWIPNVSENEDGALSFKIPNHHYDTINLYIEGMSLDGSLFSTIKNISTNKAETN